MSRLSHNPWWRDGMWWSIIGLCAMFLLIGILLGQVIDL